MNFLPTVPFELTPIFVFGSMLIIGALGGYLAHRIPWLPSITGFMVVGFLAGPSGLGLLGQETILVSRIFIDVALALILYRLGLSLDLKYLMHSPGLLLTSLLESTATFGIVFYVLHLVSIPTTLAALVAAIAISSSPAVLLHVANEVGAQGIVTKSSKTLVALNNLLSFIAFSAVLPALHHAAGAEWQTIVFEPLFRLVGSLLLGALLGFGLHAMVLKTHQASQYKLALVIGAIMVALGLAQALQLSTLFIPLVMGVVVKSLEQETIVSDLAFGAAFELFFILLFVFAGASLHLQELLDFAPAVLALVLARVLAKMLGVMVPSTFRQRPLREGAASGLLLLPMAGLAIGLAQTSSSLFPQYASSVTALILGAVTVFETIGPPIAAFAFRLAGESGAASGPPPS